MTSTLLWTLILIQMAFGAFDTLFHHEGTERLAWRPSQRGELRLHGIRNFFYSLIFLTIGWAEPKGVLAMLLIGVLVVEIFITLWDFVEEDLTRKLPASERVLHTLLALNYGAILVLLIPVIVVWAAEPTAVTSAYYGVFSWLCTGASVGTSLFGARDLAAARRLKRISLLPAARLAEDIGARKRFLVTGGTGFVGARVVEALVGAGHDVTVLTRRPKVALETLPAPLRVITDLNHISDDDRIDAIIHLAGEPISNGLWTKNKKKRVIDSRVTITKKLTALAVRLKQKPECMIAASAVGWYGIRGAEILNENAAPETKSFSHQSCSAVEHAAREMSPIGVRVVNLRIGLVLGFEGGLLSRLLTPFEFGLGGPFGDGKQMMSWITRDDLVRLIAFTIAKTSLNGPVNATAPNAVTNGAFTKAMAQALHRPAIFRVPAAPLRIALGEFARELFLSGQNVKPEKVLAEGFVFEQPKLEGALQTMLGAATNPWQSRFKLYGRTVHGAV